MKKYIKIIVIITITTILWKWIYFNIFFKETVGIKIKISEEILINLIPNVIYEEVIFRLIPFLLAKKILYFLEKKFKLNNLHKKQAVFMTFLIGQICFGTIHLQWDTNYRTIVMGLPPYPTINEHFEAFLLWGILGCLFATGFLRSIDKKENLIKQSIKGTITSIAIHFIYNLTCIKP